MTKFNSLPQEVQEEIKNRLKAYDDVDVWFEYGRYTFGTSLTKTYAPDHRFVGTYRATDVYTEEERIVNYVNEFHDYPITYKGKRDYAMLKDYNATFKMVDGNIVKEDKNNG